MRPTLAFPRAMLLPLTLTAACGGGSASVTGDINGYTLRLSTIFGWIDAKELVRNDEGKRVYQNREHPNLHLRLFGASFDPEEDQRFVDQNTLETLAQENALNGSLSMRLTRYDEVATGAPVNEPDNAPDKPQLSVDLAFGLTELESNAEYPAEVPRFGSRFSARLILNQAGRALDEVVEGTLELRVDTDEQDPSDAKTGQITVEFSAPLIAERIAECNFSSSRTDVDCEPGYPQSVPN